MSRAGGYVMKEGKTLAYFIYDGTSDIAYPSLFEFYDDAWDSYKRERRASPADPVEPANPNWKHPRPWPEFMCGDRGEPVRLHTDYGGGWSWDGCVCLEHWLITAGQDPWTDDGNRVDWPNDDNYDIEKGRVAVGIETRFRKPEGARS